MTLTVPVVLSWDLDTVAEQLDHLRNDQELLLASLSTIRSDAKDHLSTFSGNTADAAEDGCRKLSRNLSVLQQKTESAIRAFENFCALAPGVLNSLRATIAQAEDAGCLVADNGTVQGPTPDSDFSEYETQIHTALLDLQDLDLQAANALNLMAMVESYETYPRAAAGIDPRTVAAGATIDIAAGSVDETAKAFNAAGKATRGLPVLGTALGLGIGFATRPEDEPLKETLAAEAAGVATSAGIAAAGTVITTLLTGGIAGGFAGSVVPGLGTAIGFVAGAAAAAAGGTVVTEALRRDFADGKG